MLSASQSSANIGKIYGPIAQLGERLLRKQEAGGSTPPRSTLFSYTTFKKMKWMPQLPLI